jgi:hypothetical protein
MEHAHSALLKSRDCATTNRAYVSQQNSILWWLHVPRDRAMVPEKQERTDGRRQPATSHAGLDTDPRVSASETVLVRGHTSVEIKLHTFQSSTLWQNERSVSRFSLSVLWERACITRCTWGRLVPQSAGDIKEIRAFLSMEPRQVCNGKAIPLQVSTGPEGSGRLRLLDFNTTGALRWYSCKPYAPVAFTLQ